MLAKFVDAEGRERWVHVEISDSVEVREGRQRVVFIHEIKGVKVEETSNVSKLPGMLGIAKLELDAILDGKKLSLFSASYRLSKALDISREEAEELIRALCDVTGEYAIVGEDIVRL